MVLGHAGWMMLVPALHGAPWVAFCRSAIHHKSQVLFLRSILVVLYLDTTLSGTITHRYEIYVYDMVKIQGSCIHIRHRM